MSLVATLGLSPAVVVETILALERGVRRRIDRVVLVATRDDRVEACARLLCDALRKVSVDCEVHYMSSRDIASISDNVEAYQVLVGALRSAAVGGGDIVVSIAGGRKTLPALAAFAVYAAGGFDAGVASVVSRVVALVHVLVPQRVECSSACRAVCEEVRRILDGDGRGYRELVEKVARRIRELRGRYSPLCGDDTPQPEALEECIAPCVPSSLVVMPGPGVNDRVVYGFAAKRCRGRGPASIGGCAANVVPVEPKLPEDAWSMIDVVHSKPARRICEGRQLFKGFADVEHHARICSSLDPKIESVARRVEEVLGFNAEGFCLESGEKPRLKPSWNDACCCYAIEAVMPCGRSKCEYVKGVFYTTAVTRAQARSVAVKLKKELEEVFNIGFSVESF